MTQTCQESSLIYLGFSASDCSGMVSAGRNSGCLHFLSKIPHKSWAQLQGILELGTAREIKTKSVLRSRSALCLQWWQEEQWRVQRFFPPLLGDSQQAVPELCSQFLVSASGEVLLMAVKSSSGPWWKIISDAHFGDAENLPEKWKCVIFMGLIQNAQGMGIFINVLVI